MNHTLHPMEVDYHAAEFAASRRRSALPLRPGSSDLTMAALARLASALERAAARTEGWAGGAGDAGGRAVPGDARAR